VTSKFDKKIRIFLLYTFEYILLNVYIYSAVYKIINYDNKSEKYQEYEKISIVKDIMNVINEEQENLFHKMNYRI